MTRRAAITEVPAPVGVRLDSLRSLRWLLRGWYGRFIGCVAWNLLVHLSSAVAAGAAALAVSRGFTQAGTEQLLLPVVVVIGATVARAVSQWQESYTSHELAFRALARVRGWVYQALVRVASGGLRERRRGDLAATTMNDAEVLEVFAAHSSLYLLARALATPLLLVLVALVDGWVALATVPFLLLLWLVPRLTRRPALTAGEQAREHLAQMAADAQENAAAIREITAFGLVENRQQRLREQHQRLHRAQLRQATRAAVDQSLASVVQGLVLVATTWVAVLQVQAGLLDLVWVPVATSLAGATPSALLQLMSTNRHEGSVAAAARRVSAILDAPDPLPVTGTAAPPSAEAPALELSQVSYRWPGAARDAVREVSLVIRPGEQVALAGRSGSGKSTLAQLLARWYDPYQGQVCCQGSDLRSLTPEQVQSRVRLVPQFPHLFAESVRQNLQLTTDRDLDEAQLWAALDAVGMREVVAALPDGLDTVLADSGRSLSGGERQRLGLARVVLEPSPVLVLDEAVSALDTQRELSIQPALRAAGQTSVVIAHRLVTLLQAERILVLDEGRLVGDGSHQQLLTDCPEYRDLIAPQLALGEAPSPDA